MKKTQIAFTITMTIAVTTFATIRDYKEEKRSEERQKTASAISASLNSSDARFYVCENTSGEGFFWIDTTIGAVWWANPESKSWEYYGKPSPYDPAPKKGRFIPYQIENEEGLFILDTQGGEGWWTNGKEWKKMGIPSSS